MLLLLSKKFIMSTETLNKMSNSSKKSNLFSWLLHSKNLPETSSEHSIPTISNFNKAFTKRVHAVRSAYNNSTSLTSSERGLSKFVSLQRLDSVGGVESSNQADTNRYFAGSRFQSALLRLAMPHIKTLSVSTSLSETAESQASRSHFMSTVYRLKKSVAGVVSRVSKASSLNLMQSNSSSVLGSVGTSCSGHVPRPCSVKQYSCVALTPTTVNDMNIMSEHLPTDSPTTFDSATQGVGVQENDSLDASDSLNTSTFNSFRDASVPNSIQAPKADDVFQSAFCATAPNNTQTDIFPVCLPQSSDVFCGSPNSFQNSECFSDARSEVESLCGKLTESSCSSEDYFSDSECEADTDQELCQWERITSCRTPWTCKKLNNTRSTTNETVNRNLNVQGDINAGMQAREMQKMSPVFDDFGSVDDILSSTRPRCANSNISNILGWSDDENGYESDDDWSWCSDDSRMDSKDKVLSEQNETLPFDNDENHSCALWKYFEKQSNTLSFSCSFFSKQSSLKSNENLPHSEASFDKEEDRVKIPSKVCSSDSVFIRCCPFNRDSRIYPIPSAIARTRSPHLSRFRASSFFKPIFSVSSSTCFFQVFFGRPRFLLPLTSRFRATLKTLSLSLLSTCPYHPTPSAVANWSIVSLNPSVSICSSVVFLSTTF